MLAGRTGHLAAQHSTFVQGRTPRRIDLNPLHSREIDDNAIRTSPSEVTMPARPRRDFQFMTPRKLHRSQGIFFARASHDHARHPLRCCVPIKNASRAFVSGIAGDNQTSFEFGAQAVDSATTEVITIRYLKAPTAGREPKRRRGGDRSFDEVASRGPDHLLESSVYDGPATAPAKC